MYDTGAELTCMSKAHFKKLFPNNKPKKSARQNMNRILGAQGLEIRKCGTYDIKIKINKKLEIIHPVTVFSNLTDNMIIGMDLSHKTGLSYDSGNRSFYFSGQIRPWKTARIITAEDVTLEPMSNKAVKINALTSDGNRVGFSGEAVAFIRSEEFIISGGPALVTINKMGQSTMEVLNCSAYPVTITKRSHIGSIEQIEEEDEVGVLNVNEMTMEIENTPLPAATKLTAEDKKYLLDNLHLNVPEEFKQRYIDLIMKHHDVVSRGKYDLGKCTISEHDIQLKTNEPVYVKQFRIPEAHRDAVINHVQELLKLGVVRPSRSKFNSPIFIVKKKDGGLRVVQDFRALNTQTMVDKYSMRDVHECIDEIGRMGSKIFTTIDLTSGFWQMMLKPESRAFTAFTIPGIGQFEWNASPMGLLGAPGSFQRLMEIVIKNLTNVLAYIDDLLVHTKDHEKHLEILDKLFTRLRQSGLKINLPKSFFGCEEVSYLGFRLTPDGIKPGIDKLKAVKNALPPNDVHEVRQFLGLCNFFRGHIRNFAQVSAPLNALTRKDTPWKKGSPLPPEAEKAFNELKSQLVSEPVVNYPQSELTYALITDACQGDARKPGGYGAILAQITEDGSFQVVSYASRKLKDHEKNYAPFLLEMSASVWAMEHYSVYLRGKHFILYTDHKPLIKLGAVHNKTLNRMQEAMLQYDFEIIYQKGSEMPADFLSRNVVNVINVSNDEWRKIQKDEKWIHEAQQWVLNKTMPTEPLAKQIMNKYWDNKLFVDDELLWVRHTVKGEPTRVSLVVPRSKAPEILKEGHGTIFTGHEGQL
ncbi:MAG: reverse transcriptase domain-containing protein, partial [Mycobacterium sp.]